MLFAFEGRVRGGASKMLGGKDAKTSCYIAGFNK